MGKKPSMRKAVWFPYDDVTLGAAAAGAYRTGRVGDKGR